MPAGAGIKAEISAAGEWRALKHSGRLCNRSSRLKAGHKAGAIFQTALFLRENFCNRLLFEMGMFAFGRVPIAPFGQIAVKPFYSRESQHLRDSVVYYVGIWPEQGFGADVLINGSAVDVRLLGDLSDEYTLMKQTSYLGNGFHINHFQENYAKAESLSIIGVVRF